MNKSFLRNVALTLGLVGFLSLAWIIVTDAQPSRPINVASQVWEATADSSETEFLVVLAEQADLSAAADLPTREARLRYVYDTLRKTALRSQASLRAELDAADVDYRPFYIVNMLAVEGDQELVTHLAKRSEVARIEANPSVRQALPTPQLGGVRPLAPEGIEWNVTKVNADDVWALGYTGQNVVVGGQDTGYDWDHPALVSQYRGYDGATATHDYNWHDAIHSGGGSCGPDSPEPCDDHGHGTHTMGSIVGDDGGSNQIGVAPGAQWIGCRNMDEGWGTPATYIECFEFFIAPYPLGGDPLTDGDPTKAPHVINNSWSCPPREGCDWDTLQNVVENVRAAGIMVVVSAGNEGSSCSTVSNPPALYDASFSVGATSSSDGIASFSSRGPVTIDGSGRLKPDISAPGVSVRSSRNGGGYTSMSGTSMAGPHVAGTLALLWSAAPSLIGDLETTERIITQTARPRTTTQGCGGDGPDDVPNNVYGWGIVDALAAVQGTATPSLKIVKRAEPDPVLPGAPLTYTLRLTNTGNVDLQAIVTDTLPASVTPSGVMTWATGAIPPGDEWTETVLVTVAADYVGPLTNVVRVTAAEGASGVYTATTQVETVPALLISKRAEPDPVLPGAPLTYTLRLTNTGNVDLQAIVTDTLPASVAPSGVMTWATGAIPPGDEWTETVLVTVAADYVGPLTNVVRATTAEGASGVYTATTQVETVPALLISKRAEPDPVLPGAPLTYTLRLTNTGNVDLQAIVTDTLPASVAPSGVMTWATGAIPPGDEWTETVVVTVAADYVGPLTNVVWATTAEGASGAYTITTYSLASSLELTKQASFPMGFPIHLLVYNLTVTNSSPFTFTQVVLTDTIPTSTTFAWASGSYTLTEDVIAWRTASLEPQEKMTVTLAVDVGQLSPGRRIVSDAYGVSAKELLAPVTSTSMGAKVESVIPWRCLLLSIFKNWSAER